MIPTCNNKTIEVNARRVLPVLTVFAEWCSLNPEYLDCSSLECDSRSNRRGRTGEKISLKEKEKTDAMKAKMIMRRTYYTLESVQPSVRMIKIEEEAKESMKSCLSSLEEFITLSLGAGIYFILLIFFCLIEVFSIET